MTDFYTYGNTLSPGETAKSAEVGAEFTAIQTAFAQVQALLARVVMTLENIPVIPQDAANRAGKMLTFDPGTGDPVATSVIPIDTLNLPLAINQGGTGKTTASAALAALGGVPITRSIIAGAGLTDGGQLNGNVALNVGAGTGIIVNTNAVTIDTTVVPRLNAANIYTGAQTLMSATPTLELYETDADADEKLWKVVATGGTWRVNAKTDDDATGTTAILIERTLTNIDHISLNADSVTKNGLEVATVDDLHFPVFYRKTASEIVALSTTLQDDNVLANMVLEAGTFYRMEAFLPFEGFGGGAKYKFVLSTTLESEAFTRLNSDGTGNPNVDLPTTVALAAAGDIFVLLVGYLHTNSGPDVTMTLQWAQQSANVLGTTLLKGAYVRLEKM